MAQTGLAEFKEVITDYRSLMSWAMSGAVAVPLADWLLKFGPPWPDGAPVITCLAGLITLISIFHFWFAKSHQQLSRRMRIGLVVLLISFTAYLFLSDRYTFIPPSATDRYVKGFVIREDVRPLITPEHPADKALEEANYKADEVWSGWSITTMRVGLLLIWLIAFGSLSLFIGTFVMAQRRKVVEQSSNQPPTPVAAPGVKGG